MAEQTEKRGRSVFYVEWKDRWKSVYVRIEVERKRVVKREEVTEVPAGCLCIGPTSHDEFTALRQRPLPFKLATVFSQIPDDPPKDTIVSP